MESLQGYIAYSNQSEKMRVVDECFCPIYKLQPKTAGQFLWDCEASRDVRGQNCKRIQKISFSNSSFLNIWSYLTTKLDRIELEGVAIVAMLMWARRNDLIHQYMFSHPNNIISKAKAMLHEFMQARTVPSSMPIPHQSSFSHTKWKKPPTGPYKIYWDASCNAQRGKLDLKQLSGMKRALLLALSELPKTIIVVLWWQKSPSSSAVVQRCQVTTIPTRRGLFAGCNFLKIQ